MDMTRDRQSLDEYTQTKRLTSHLSLIAALARVQLVEYPHQKSTLREEVKAFYEQNAVALLRAAAECDEVQRAAKRWECKHWFGGTQKPLSEAEVSRRTHEWFTSKEKRTPERFGLQKMYLESDVAGFSGRNEDCVVRMLGTAGRVLVTISAHEIDDDAPWITLIFDETAGFPRGGVQGLFGRRFQLLGLLDRTMENLPELKPDSEVAIC